MKNKYSLSIAGILLILTMLCSFLALPVSAATEAEAAALAKIDSVLADKLESMNDTEAIAVSVWFTDIDYDELKENVKNEVIATSSLSESVSQEAVELVFYDVENNNIANYSLETLTNVYSDVTVEEVKQVVAVEREIASNMYREHNNSIIEDILPPSVVSRESLSATEFAGASSISYICRYAPNVDMYLTKSQIYEIANSDYVTEINYRNTEEMVAENEIATSNLVQTLSDYDYDMTFQSVTGLSVARDAFGLSGVGMNVGMIEYGSQLPSFGTNANIESVYTKPLNIMSYNLHSGLVASIMVASEYDESGNLVFEGAIPNANLFFASISSDTHIKSATEALLDEQVVAINVSCSFPEGTSTGYFNSYGDIAKWYDYVTVNRNVHMILSAGNYGSSGVKWTNTSYNSLVVGACDNNGALKSYSSYINSNTKMNKPDLVAPGHISAPAYSSDGTSFAAPLVTSAVIQLSQYSSILYSNPTLMKALLLGSATITDSMSDSEVYSAENGTTSAISKQYGAGMLSVTKAYTALSNSYYKTGTFSPYSTSVDYNKNISRAANKTIRVCLNWDKINTGSASAITSLTLDNLKLTVTTPSGKVYSSQKLYDNKQMITFVATENGQYNFKIERFGSGSSNQILTYALAYSVQ